MEHNFASVSSFLNIQKSFFPPLCLLPVSKKNLKSGMFVHYISFYSFSRSLTAIRLCWSATLFWKAIFSHLNFKPLLDYPTAQILPLWKRGKEAAINYYCSSPFPRSWELKDNKCCYADKLKVLCKLGIGTLQLSYFQGWLFKGLVKLILYQFFFMDFPLRGKFKCIKCLSIVSVHWKWTIKKISGWQGVYMGSSHELYAL